MDWIFDIENTPDKYAEHDPIGGAAIMYLKEVGGVFEEAKFQDMSRILSELICQIIIHEELHNQITVEADTLGDQEHITVYEWIQSALT